MVEFCSDRLISLPVTPEAFNPNARVTPSICSLICKTRFVLSHTMFASLVRLSNHYTFNMLVWVYFPNFLQCDSLVDSLYRLVKGTPLYIHSLLLRSQYDAVSLFSRRLKIVWSTFPVSLKRQLEFYFSSHFSLNLFSGNLQFFLPFQIVWGNYCCLMWPNHKWVNIWAMIVH